MNPRHECQGLQSPLSNTAIIPQHLRCHNRLHDGSPGYVYRGITISVIGIAAGLTDKRGLALAVRFRTMAAHATRSRRVTGVNSVQWHASKSSLIGEEEPELKESPRSMLRTLGPSNRAIGTFPNVPQVL